VALNRQVLFRERSLVGFHLLSTSYDAPSTASAR